MINALVTIFAAVFLGAATLATIFLMGIMCYVIWDGVRET